MLIVNVVDNKSWPSNLDRVIGKFDQPAKEQFLETFKD